MLTHIKSTAEFDTEIAKGNVLVDFFATWCGPCSMLSPIVEKLAKEHPDLKVLKVDVDENPEVASRFDVYSIPTLIYFTDGKAQRTQVGYVPEASLKRFADVK